MQSLAQAPGGINAGGTRVKAVHAGGPDVCSGKVSGGAGAREHTCTGKLPGGGRPAHLQLPDNFHREGRAAQLLGLWRILTTLA